MAKTGNVNYRQCWLQYLEETGSSCSLYNPKGAVCVALIFNALIRIKIPLRSLNGSSRSLFNFLEYLLKEKTVIPAISSDDKILN